VLLGVDGISDFNGLHSRKHDDEVQFYDFDILVSDGDDIRKVPLTMRKANLARLLSSRVDGIFLSDFEQGEIGPDLFRHACLMGLEGLVSKHRDRPYRAAVRHTGSRLRTASIPLWCALWTRSHDCPKGEKVMENETDPLARFGIDPIDLRWTLKDIAANRTWIINKEHLAQLIDLGPVEMRDDAPFLTAAGQNAAWES
jgi:hypothetical protein